MSETLLQQATHSAKGRDMTASQGLSITSAERTRMKSYCETHANID